MSLPSPPPVDPRTYAGFVEQTERLLARYTGWVPPEGDPAAALVRVVARMAERVSDRLNRMPDRGFLAFLNLIGVEPRPPEPARVPLTFALAAGARADAVVPARTAVAGQPLEGEAGPVVFETERELVVTRTTLDAVVVHDPARDQWADRGGQAAAGPGFAAFAGDDGVMHRLHLSHPHAFGADAPKTVQLRMSAEDPAAMPLLAQLEWSWRDAAGDHPLPAGAVTHPTPWEAVFTGLPSIPPSQVDGVEGRWLSARLRVPLALRGQAPRTVLAGGAWADPEATLFPYGQTAPAGPFAVSVPRGIAIPGAAALLEVRLVEDVHPAPVAMPGLQLQWEYLRASGWAPLGVSSPAAEAVGGAGPLAFADGTRALTTSGTVRFLVPGDWGELAMEGLAGTWLRARVVSGGYAEDEDEGYRGPAVRRLELGYDLPVPRVGGMQARVERTETNAVARDAGDRMGRSMDFRLYGRNSNRVHGFYLALPQLRDRAGAQVTLAFDVNPPPTGSAALSTQPTLRWEFWNAAARRWDPFGESRPGTPATFGYGFVDGTRSLTTDGSVTFTAPALGEVEWIWSDAWIRVTITSGEYTQWLGANQARATHVVPADLDSPWVISATLTFTYLSAWTAPDAAVAENGWSLETRRAAAGVLPPLVPFPPPADPRPSLYLGFRRPGEEAGFANRAATLYLGVGETPFGEAEAHPQAPPSLAWWYWDGAGWARLAGVRDETAALTRRGMVTFVAPPDLRAHTLFGRTAFWLRVTVESGGWPHPPRLERVLLNTVWAEHAARVAGEVLGSGNGKPAQRFRTVRAPVLPGERIEVREADSPSPAELAALAAEGGPGALAVPAAGVPGVWVRWTCVPDFHASGPESRHYVLDRLSGEVRFGDGTQGRVPPPGQGNVRAAVYRTGGGPAGNRPAGNLAVLRTPVPYVDRVANPEPAAGGAPAEALDAVRERGPRTLRHRGRAVTLADLEDLAVEASPEVAVARAVPALDGEEAGRVRVIVVPRSAAARPVPSLELLDRVEAYLAGRVPATVELEVLGPEWVEVAVTAEVVPEAPELATAVQAELPARLAAFLHPLTGGPRGAGWPFGRQPQRSDLYAVVEAVSGVDHVRRLQVHASPIPRTPFFLVHSGAHTVWVTGSTDA